MSFDYDIKAIDELFDRIEASLSESECRDQVRQRVARLQRIIDEFEAAAPAEANEAYAALAHRAIEIMAINVSTPLTISQIAAECETSPTTLKQTFRSIMGQPIYSWYRAHRIARACTLLAETDIPIAQVASAVGYTNPSKFSKAFRDETGKTPREWRAQALGR